MADQSGDPRVHNLTPEDVARGLTEGRMLLVDVREQNEVDVESYPDAAVVPLSSFDPAAIPDPQGRQVPGFLQTLAAHLATEQSDLLKELESLCKKIDHIKDIIAMQQDYAKVSGVALRWWAVTSMTASGD